MDFEERLQEVRERMQEHKVTHYFSAYSDPHISEFPNSSFLHLEWLCNFKGLYGYVLITHTNAYLWTDEIYYDSAVKQVPTPLWKVYSENDTDGPMDILMKSKRKVVLALNYSTTPAYLLGECLDEKNVRTIDLDVLDELNKKQLVFSPLSFFRTKYSVTERLDIFKKSRKNNVIVLTSLVDVAWVFNIRGDDILYSPLALAFAILTPKRIMFFCGTTETLKYQQFPDEFKTLNIEIFPYANFYGVLNKELHNVNLTVRIREKFTSFKILEMARKANAEVKFTIRDIDNWMGVCPNGDVEQLKKAHIEDSLILCQFFAQIEQHYNTQKEEKCTDFQLCELLETLRKSNPDYVYPSFASIIANGPNAANLHYQPNEHACSEIDFNRPILFDVGAQYKSGATTDVTRVLCVGDVTEEDKKVYTAVLKGHIALQKEQFSEHTRFENIDKVCRDAIKRVDTTFEYEHATGHGVGCFSSVHHDPDTFAGRAALDVGRMTSVEPGLYFKGNFGVRIENVCIVEYTTASQNDKELKHTEERSLVHLVPLTYVPYCLKAIQKDLLDSTEINYLDQYSQRIRELVLPLTQDPITKKWIEENTIPL
ncbi:xaa-pro dipeptidase, putative [Entamoeba invadens IP1]|uniref:Xaa-pro dipeptidase, putative n=1 Tax=Entamoeba invadens IP1 TaxID=370355 RepID=A0A0A1UFJ2_ENTIV|nr:xaa-pro dipeptidase, putative [Entamoeba invadens IP1]ELP92704.1 xaa-pro dipeptidase, putative [Entamoeba invadens IP1]|eukprot:XP_004259475.1 xaa-pro dipeptidase, putative [Entamoeba invadens IP1]